MPNASTLTVTLVAHAQRSTLQLRADAKILGGNTTLEHWVWDFPEVPDPTRIELVSEPGDTYDPPDRSGGSSDIVSSEPDPQSGPVLAAVEQEMKQIEALIRKDIESHQSCSFCGRGKDAVSHMIAGPGAMICDTCVAACSELLARGSGDV